jgi:pimeloyl-ACP methyl ester carboxylesterase
LSAASSSVTDPVLLAALPSIVLVHAIGGDVSGYLPLANALTTPANAGSLPVGRNVLAIRARSLDADVLHGPPHSHEPFDDMQAQATFYLSLLLQEQCRDALARATAERSVIDTAHPLQLQPFLLGGHSYGGTAAFEIARQLEELRLSTPFIRWEGPSSTGGSRESSGLHSYVFALPPLPPLFMFDAPVYPKLPLAAEMRDELDILYTVAGRAAGLSEEQWAALRVELRDDAEALMAYLRESSNGRVAIDHAIFRTWIVHLKGLVEYRAERSSRAIDTIRLRDSSAAAASASSSSSSSSSSFSPPRSAYSAPCLFLTPMSASRFTGPGFHLPWLDLCRGVPLHSPADQPGAMFVLERITGDHYAIMQQTKLLHAFIARFAKTIRDA